MIVNPTAKVRLGHSLAADARTAVAEFHQQVAQPNAELVLFFCSSSYELDILAEEMNRLFPAVPVVGCTTAGEIGTAGYTDRSLSGMSFPRDGFTSVSGRLELLQNFEVAQGRDLAQQLLKMLEARGVSASAENTFGFLLVDGLSMREEPVAHTLQHSLRQIRLIGGSAGDDLKLAATWVFHEGRFHKDCAVLLLINTPYEFRLFKTQHFDLAEERLVVTAADSELRVVNEINGLPAAQEYARLVGVTPEELGPEHFAASPIVIMVDGTDYVRSIQKANPDGSLTFYCAIDEGLVLRVGKALNLIADLEQTFSRLRTEIGDPQAVLACDCILRNLEITQGGQKSAAADIYRRNNAVGFSTYGEQFGGVHVNQTLTGIAIGQKLRTDD